MRVAYSLAVLLFVVVAEDHHAAPSSLPPPLRGASRPPFGDAGADGKPQAAAAASAGAGVVPADTAAAAAAAEADRAALAALAANLSESGNISADGSVEGLLLMRGGWHQGGDKMWGSGAGVESISRGNVGYYNAGMYAAHGRCGGAGCALIVNPPGHRSVQQFHIHFVHYRGYGASLKHRLEGRVCGRYGWHGGGLPCGGRAAYFRGFPAVFSQAMAGGDIHHASVIAWPASCGGRGTIVELAYGCSIEHQIRGDYNSRYR